MKKYLIVIFFASIFWGYSDKETVNKDIPGWLQVKVNEIKTGNNVMNYRVSEYQINQKTYYNISMLHQSCMLCDVYDKEGNQVPISFNPNSEIKHIRTIWPEIR
jgi:hypothetical protein